MKFIQDSVTLIFNQEECTCSLILRENCILVILPFVAQKTSNFIRIILKASSWVTKQYVPFTHSSNIYCILTSSVLFRFQIYYGNKTTWLLCSKAYNGVEETALIKSTHIKCFKSSTELSILFHWSMFLSLCQYHTVLMTVAL